MSEPMSAERLARIRERAVRAACGKHKDDGWLFCRIDAPELLAEVERLRTAEESLVVENARMRTENDVMFQDLCRARKFGDETAHLMGAAIKTREKAKDAMRKQISHTLRARKQRDVLTAEVRRLREVHSVDVNKMIATETEVDAYKADIEAGRLIRIPCREFYENAGGIAWFVWEGEVIETVQCGAQIDAEGRLYVVLVCEDKIFPYRTPIAEYDMEMSDWCTNDKAVDAEDYQRTVFMTEEAARAALGKEREDG